MPWRNSRKRTKGGHAALECFSAGMLNDDTLLRWCTCLRMTLNHHHQRFRTKVQKDASQSSSALVHVFQESFYYHHYPANAPQLKMTVHYHFYCATVRSPKTMLSVMTAQPHEGRNNIKLFKMPISRNLRNDSELLCQAHSRTQLSGTTLIFVYGALARRSKRNWNYRSHRTTTLMSGITEK